MYNITDSDGFYYIEDVPIVDCYWNVSASKKGYDTSWVEIPIDINSTYNFVLTTLNNTLFVGGNGPNNYSRIQDAVDNASDGDTVYVYNGIYYENVGIRKSIDLVGEDRNSTIIDGLNKSSAINVGAQWVTIEKFTIGNGTIGIEGWCNNFTISSNIIVNNEKGIKLDDLVTSYDNNKVKMFAGWMSNCIGDILLKIDNQHISEAEDWIQKAIESNKRNGMMWYLAKDYALYAELFNRKGDLSRAKENLSKAIDIFKECGADGWVEKYEKELATFS